MVIRGAKQNARRVSAAGIPVVRYQLLAYVLSGMLCGVAGLLLANLNAFASPSTLAWSVSGELIVIVVIGGLGTVFGPLMGALVFLGLEELLKGWTDHWMVIFGPLIVLVALLGKRGIVGMLERFDARDAGRSEPEPGPSRSASVSNKHPGAKGAA
jgi:branched-chain amino acid transport system permease protein